MGKICLQCGDRGFTNAFVYCVKCLDVAVHRYCLDIIPETFDEFVRWVCDDCQVEARKQSAVCQLDVVPSQSGDPIDMNYEHATLYAADERKRCQRSSSQQLEEEKSNTNLMQHAKLSDDISLKKNMNKKRRIMESTMSKNQHRLADALSKQSHEGSAKVDIRERARLASNSTLPSKLNDNKSSEPRDQRRISMKPCDSDTDPGMSEHPTVSYNGSLKSSKKKKTVMSSAAILREQIHRTSPAQTLKENKGFNLENQCASMNTEDGKFGPSDIQNRESDDKEDRTSAPRHRSNFCKDHPKDLDNSSAEPVVMPIWRGSFNIWKQKHDVLDGLIAHISSKACQKVYAAACHFEPVLHLEMLPRSGVWPKSFMTSEPSGDNIALYFFPSRISERVFDQLVDEMMRKELALKGSVQNAELLIFTSTELPLLYWRFQGKYYLWGVFRGQQSPSPHSPSCTGELGDNPMTRHTDLWNHTGSSGGKIPKAIKRCRGQSPLSPLSYGSGST